MCLSMITTHCCFIYYVILSVHHRVAEFTVDKQEKFQVSDDQTKAFLIDTRLDHRLFTQHRAANAAADEKEHDTGVEAAANNGQDDGSKQLVDNDVAALDSDDAAVKLKTHSDPMEHSLNGAQDATRTMSEVVPAVKVLIDDKMVTRSDVGAATDNALTIEREGQNQQEPMN